MQSTIEIAGRRIGPECPPYVICEISGNHNQSLDRALDLIDAAAKTGCDAIKIQSYTPDTLTIQSDRDEFLIKSGLWEGRTLYDLYAEAHTPFEWHEALFERAKQLGVTLFSTPFDETAVDLLDGLGAPAFKIASFEATDVNLIKYTASKGKPLIISTGLANLGEIETAVAAARGAGCTEIALLHCVSSYPAPHEDSNLRVIPHLGDAFGTVVGLSDHTMGVSTSVASIALGGSIIEKHFTLSRNDGGPDADFSLEPAEFTRLCSECNDAWIALGKVGYSLAGSEVGNLQFRRSLYATAAIAKGEAFTSENVRSIRPGFGLDPKYRDEVIGTHATRDIERAEPIDWSMIDQR